MKIYQRQESYTKKDNDGKSRIVEYTAFYVDFENGLTPKKIVPVFKSDYDVFKLMALHYETKKGKSINE